MNKNVLIVLAGGFVVAILVAVLVQASLGGSKKADDSAPKSQVLVAAKNLPLGTNLSEGDLKWQSWPGKPFQGAIVRKGEEKTVDALNGRLIQKVSEGQPVLRNAVFKEGRGNIVAASLAPGKRAIGIAVKPKAIAGGFVTPGDFVDVVLTYRVNISGRSREAQKIVDRYATETIVRNARVVAMDTSAEREDDDKGKVGKTVTIEVTAAEAEKVALGAKMGDLTLTLRSLGDEQPVEDTATTDVALSNVMQDVIEASESGKGSKGGVVRIYSGPTMVEQTPRSIRPVSTNGNPEDEEALYDSNDWGMGETEIRDAILNTLEEGSADMLMNMMMNTMMDSMQNAIGDVEDEE